MNTETALSWKCTHSSIAAKGGNKKFITPFSNTFVLKNCAFKSEKITQMWRRWDTPQNFFWHLFMNLKNKLLLKKLLKWANKKQIILIFTMLHFFKKNIKKDTCRYHYQNLDDMIYSSWDIEQSILNLVILGHFLSFYPQKPPKLKF